MPSSPCALLFLRPLALPRPATLNYFLGVSRLSTITATTSPTAPRAQTSAKPYLIRKTPNNQSPIYTLKKRGGNKLLTKIRRIEGDLAALKSDLVVALKLDPSEVTINQLTRHVLVKGHVRPAVEQFLVKEKVLA